MVVLVVWVGVWDERLGSVYIIIVLFSPLVLYYVDIHNY